MPEWRVADSLLQLRDQINHKWPKRAKGSDGTIGNSAHRKKWNASDHNPWVTSGGTGVVTAMDITHDPYHGVNCADIVAAIVKSRDHRVKYIIHNGSIWNSSRIGWHRPWARRRYTGSNPHRVHLHISVKPQGSAYDDPRSWKIS